MVFGYPLSPFRGGFIRFEKVGLANRVMVSSGAPSMEEAFSFTESCSCPDVVCAYVAAWFHDIELGPKQLFCCCAFKMKKNNLFSSCNHNSDVASSDRTQHRGTNASLYGQVR